MSADQQALHDNLLTNLLDVLTDGVQCIILNNASQTLIEFCAYGLFAIHHQPNALDLLNSMYEAERLAQLIVGLKQQK